MNKAELGQVFTDKIIADYMVSLLSVDKSSRLLDPCFGGAAFIDALQRAGFTSITGCEIDHFWFNKANKRLIDVTLIEGDFLKYTSDELYDAVIMNPPYIRQEKIDDLSVFGICKDELSDNPIFRILPRTANLYMYFVLKGFDLLRENGEMVIIFPSSWLDAKNGSEFKDYLYNECDVVKQVHVYGNVFEGTALVDVVILKVIKRKTTNSTAIIYLQAKDNTLSQSEAKRAKISLDFATPFSSYAMVRRGLTTGYNEAFINPDCAADISSFFVPIISSPKDICGYSTTNARLDNLLLVDDESKITDELQSYLNSIENSILENKKPKTLHERISHGDKWYRLTPFSGEGIIFSYFVRNEMKFVYNPSNIIIRDNFYVITPSINPLLMFAILNNHYTFYQLECSGKKYGAGLLKLQRYDIEELRMPDISLFSDDDINELIRLSKELIKTEDISIVNNITRVIASYSDISADSIINEYREVKQHRLENA